MENDLKGTFDNLKASAQGFSGFIDILSNKITPELLSTMTEDQRSQLHSDMSKLNKESSKLSELPNMLDKAMAELKKHNL